MNDEIERLARLAYEAWNPRGVWSELEWTQRHRWHAVAEALGPKGAQNPASVFSAAVVNGAKGAIVGCAGSHLGAAMRTMVAMGWTHRPLRRTLDLLSASVPIVTRVEDMLGLSVGAIWLINPSFAQLDRAYAILRHAPGLMLVTAEGLPE